MQFLCYRKKKKNDLEKLLYLCYLLALEKSNSMYIASIVEPCVSKNQNKIFTMWVWLKRKSWKRAKAVEKGIPELKAKFVCMCVWERKNNSFEIHIIILRYIRNVNLPFKKDFKFAELVTKTSFFLYFGDCSKSNGETKLRRRRKYKRKSN